MCVSPEAARLRSTVIQRITASRRRWMEFRLRTTRNTRTTFITRTLRSVRVRRTYNYRRARTRRFREHRRREVQLRARRSLCRFRSDSDLLARIPEAFVDCASFLFQIGSGDDGGTLAPGKNFAARQVERGIFVVAAGVTKETLLRQRVDHAPNARPVDRSRAHGAG